MNFKKEKMAYHPSRKPSRQRGSDLMGIACEYCGGATTGGAF
jgi:hypothetical protein